MRVITGSARGRRLETLPGNDTRPTTDRVKEAVFSAVQFGVEGRRVLDLFAGSGQMGIEALSRGAAGAVFVDKNPDAAAIIKKNLQSTNLFCKAQVLCTDALDYLKRKVDRFDLVFLDPPYAAGLLIPALENVVPLMNDGGLIICESDDDLQLPERAGKKFSLYRTYRYGRVHIWVYQ